MKRVSTRVAAVAFPASAVVIISAAIAKGAFGVEIDELVAAAATGLLTYLAFVFLGAGENADKN